MKASKTSSGPGVASNLMHAKCFISGSRSVPLSLDVNHLFVTLGSAFVSRVFLRLGLGYCCCLLLEFFITSDIEVELKCERTLCVA